MNANSVVFDALDFPSNWHIPDDCSGQIFVGGLSPARAEAYYIIDFDKRELIYCEINVETHARDMANYMAKTLPSRDLPYGETDFFAATSNFIQPHEALRLTNGLVAVAMHNAAYVRLIDFSNQSVSNYPDSAGYEPWAFSATNCLSSEADRYFFAQWPLQDRLDRYADPSRRLNVTVKSCNATSFSDVKDHATLQTQESIHEVKVDPSSTKVLLTEFCLSANASPPQNASDVFMNPALWSAYESKGLKDSSLYLLDLTSGAHSTFLPSGKTPGHVEFSRAHENTFYLSCHNLSKANGRVILHGPATLLAIEIKDTSLYEKWRYHEDHFIRATSHLVFEYAGESYLAVTGYPNFIYLFRDGSLDLCRIVELFSCDPIDPRKLHFSLLGEKIPIWLETSTNGRYLIAISNSNIYVYDLEANIVERMEKYNFRGPYIGTAHVTNLARFPQNRSPVEGQCSR